MAQFLRSVLQQDVALAASTVLDPVDLPVNPLSHILLTVRGLNNTGTLANYRVLANFLDFITRVEITFRGQAIISGNLADIAILNGILTGHAPVIGQITDVDDRVRYCTFLISFSRQPFWMEEAFPSVRRGELQLNITSGAAPAGMDGFTIQTETVELLDVTPERFLKYTTLTKTPTATGDHDIDLPIGNDILGVMLFGTSVPTLATFNASFGQVRLLVDNVEHGYANTNWETLHGELMRRLSTHFAWQGHVHRITSDHALTAATEETTREEQTGTNIFANRAYLDYDPHPNVDYSIKTSGRARVNLRVNADVADLVRVIPVELVRVSGAPGAVPVV